MRSSPEKRAGERGRMKGGKTITINLAELSDVAASEAIQNLGISQALCLLSTHFGNIQGSILFGKSDDCTKNFNLWTLQRFCGSYVRGGRYTLMLLAWLSLSKSLGILQKIGLQS